jgi:hypothetical protein
MTTSLHAGREDQAVFSCMGPRSFLLRISKEIHRQLKMLLTKDFKRFLDIACEGQIVFSE